MSGVEAIDYDSPYPECRVLSTVDPYVLVRFDMNRDQAALFAKRCRSAADRHDGDGLVTLGITMWEPTYRVFADQIENLVQLSSDVDDDLISAQVVLDHDLEDGDPAGISVSVLLNESQLHSVHDNAQDALARSDGHLHRWEFTASPGGVDVLVQQLIAAVKGADDPLDHVDTESAGVA